jgi:predicted Zn-dependent protease
MKFALPALILILAALELPAQQQNEPDFDDLARRAAAAFEQDPQQAAALYAQAVQLRPSWAEGWYDLGASEYRLKRYPAARDALVRAGALAPHNGAVWAFLGLAEYELKDYPQALEQIVKAEGVGLPDNLPFVRTVRICGAMILMRKSDFTAAVEQLHPLVLSGDKSPDVIEVLGVAALTRPWLPPDIPAAKLPLVELAGGALWALYDQQWKDAETLFHELGEKYPNEPGVHYLLGIYDLGRDLKAALAEFEAERKLSPSDAMVYAQIGMIHMQMGQPAAALEPAREGVRLAPKNLLCHLILGRALLATGKTNAAIAEFEKAVKLNPAYPHTHFYLAQAYQRAGRAADAAREQAEFSRLKGAGSPTVGTGLPPTPVR